LTESRKETAMNDDQPIPTDFDEIRA